MGVLTDYFSAPSDAAAASALDRVGGPGQSAAGSSPSPPFDTFQSKGLDPYVIMGKLGGAHRTGLRTITSGPQYGRMVAKGGAQGPWVVKVSSQLQAALSLAGSDQLARAAARWRLPVQAPHQDRRRMAHSGRQLRVIAAIRRIVPGSQRS